MSNGLARACANIALVKYWGKRDVALNLPAAGSLSLTLGALTTTTAVRFDASIEADELMLDGRQVATDRLSPWLDLVRKQAGIDHRAQVTSVNDFPTSAGLASSASAYAALAVAASAAAGLELSKVELSALARRGSGSAARSIFGGFAEMGDEFARPLEDPTSWDLRMVIAIAGRSGPKAFSSRDAMEHCAETSPLYKGWLASVPTDLKAARAAVKAHDLEALGAVMQHSALAMHAAALASRPPVRYWRPATLAILDCVEAIDGAYYTMDAGPHVKVLTETANADAVASKLRKVDGVSHVIVSGPGGPAELISAG